MNLSKITMYEACLLHSRAERVLKSVVSCQLEEWKITRMEWLLLATVQKKAKQKYGHTMGEIAGALDIQLSQVTALVNKLSRSKSVKQIVSPDDKRTRYLQITGKGNNLISEIEVKMRGAMREWLKDIPRDQLAVYMQTVQMLANEKR